MIFSMLWIHGWHNCVGRIAIRTVLLSSLEEVGGGVVRRLVILVHVLNAMMLLCLMKTKVGVGRRGLRKPENTASDRDVRGHERVQCAQEGAREDSLEGKKGRSQRDRDG